MEFHFQTLKRGRIGLFQGRLAGKPFPLSEVTSLMSYVRSRSRWFSLLISRKQTLMSASSPSDTTPLSASSMQDSRGWKRDFSQCVRTRKRTVLCRLVRKNTLFITCHLGRHSHVTPCNICDCRKDSNEGFRMSKSALVVAELRE